MHFPFTAPVKGISFRQPIARTVAEGDRVWCRQESANDHDPCAMVITTAAGDTLGYLPAPLAHRLAHEFGPTVLRGTVKAVLHGPSGPDEWSSTGLRVTIEGPSTPQLVPIHARSGRTLGALVSRHDSHVVVQTTGGQVKLPVEAVESGTA